MIALSARIWAERPNPISAATPVRCGMGTESSHPPVGRHEALLTALADLSGSELKTVLLELARRRAKTVTPAAVSAAYRTDRFVRPSPIDLATRNQVESAFLAALPGRFERIVLAPLVPFAAHVALASVHQDLIVSTSRGTEVAADPTLALALEASERRREHLRQQPKSSEQVRLASVQRITRAQKFEGADSWTHFDVMALVTAGRDTGHETFEAESLREHIEIHGRALLAAGADEVFVRVTDFSPGRFVHTIHTVVEACDDLGGALALTLDPDRTAGRNYYSGIVFNTTARISGYVVDVGDGGFVDWSQKLVANRKERLLTSGIGIDRIAIATAG